MKLSSRNIARLIALVLYALIGYFLKVPENIVIFTGLMCIIAWYIFDLDVSNKRD